MGKKKKKTGRAAKDFTERINGDAANFVESRINQLQVFEKPSVISHRVFATRGGEGEEDGGAAQGVIIRVWCVKKYRFVGESDRSIRAVGACACTYARAHVFASLPGSSGIRARAAAAAGIRQARGYRFDSSHSSKSNKKLIESVTPPDFTNEISKYQFHVTLF